MINHLGADSAETTAAEQLGKGFADGQWFMAMFSVRDGVLYLQDTSFQFPMGRGEEAMKLLWDEIQLRLGVIQPPALPLADHLADVAGDFQKL